MTVRPADLLPAIRQIADDAASGTAATGALRRRYGTVNVDVDTTP